MQRLYENLFYSKAVSDLFDDRSFLQAMLRVEAALSAAQAEIGLIPSSAAKTIAKCCNVDSLKMEVIIEETGLGANATIPLVKQLRHAVSLSDPEASRYVHFGVTSQDIIDTAIALQLKTALSLISADVNPLIDHLVELITAHRNTLMVGRSFKQHARPITFGYKVARWLDPLLRARKKLAAIQESGLLLQLGGAIGTLSGMDDKGGQVATAMAKLLGLNVPNIPHSQSDQFAEVATALGILQGIIAKIAEDISLMMQTELDEVAESSKEGRGGSSSMPHKRNPVGCIAILANSKRMPGLVSTMLHCLTADHERATGSWHAQWETLAAIVKLSAGSTRQGVLITHGLEVNKQRMLHNLELTNGLIYAENVAAALAKHLGRPLADEWTENFCRESIHRGTHLREIIDANTEATRYLTATELDRLFDPRHAIGMCDEFIDAVLKATGV